MGYIRGRSVQLLWGAAVVLIVILRGPLRAPFFLKRVVRFVIASLITSGLLILLMSEPELKPAKYERYGVLQNGILLHGPRGTGKTFLARATAGKFGLNFEYVSARSLLNRFIGATGTNIQQVFAQAAARHPVLLFIDEIDAIGTGRQEMSGGGDPGGAGREFNNIATALMSAIDQYRSVNGFVLMAATNRLDGLDEALIREGRFDVRTRVDLPDEAAREEILRAQLSKNPGRGSI